MPLTQSLRCDAALRPRIYDPVVELEGVDCLQHRADPSHAAVDVRVSQKVRRQVAVQPGLHSRRSVDPESRVEQDVIQELPGQKGLAERLH